MNDKRLARVMWGVLIGLMVLYAIGMLWGPATSGFETAEASPVPNSGTGTEVLSADRVGEATVYQLLVGRDGYLPFYCVMVQENTGSGNLGGHVAIDCP